MWALRILTGPQAGKILELNEGKNTLGRSASCDLQIEAKGVSKEHAHIFVTADKVILTDAGSRNGTFVEGIKIQNRRVSLGDKVGFHDVLCEVVDNNTLIQQSQLVQLANQNAVGQSAPIDYPQSFQHSYEGHNEANADFQQDSAETNEGGNVLERGKQYIDSNLMPGIYVLAEKLELKYIIAIFVGLYIVLITFLSVIPMVQITKTSIEKESRRHALTIAKQMAENNRAAIRQSLDSYLSTQASELEEGVKTALIIDHSDGHVLAPVTKAGQYPDYPFIHRARREQKQLVEQMDANTVGASVPIAFYNAERGENTVAAHAVVIYDMSTLAIDEGRTLSLVFQTLIIALIVGFILYYFLYKLIEHPVVELNRQVDKALKSGSDSVSLPFLFPAIQKLSANISSVLNRSLSGPEQGELQSVGAGKEIEADNIIHLIGFAAMAVKSPELTILSMNPVFEDLTGLYLNQLKHQSVESINDQALKLSLLDLAERVAKDPNHIANNSLDFRGEAFEVSGQAVVDGNDIAYIVFVIHPVEEEEAE